jgi:uncharacterized protein DUF3310
VSTETAPTSKPNDAPSTQPGVTVSIGRVVDPARGDHYGTMNMQPLDFILANNLDFCAGNVIKYTTRGALGPRHDLRLVDLRKARHYLEILIIQEEERGSRRLNFPGQT